MLALRAFVLNLLARIRALRLCVLCAFIGAEHAKHPRETSGTVRNSERAFP